MSTIKGLEKARRDMRHRAAAFRGQRGTLYPQLSTVMKAAIRDNADKSYRKSPAKDIAIKSADNWKHADPLHLLGIISTCYANFRQYGCGGLPIHKLVVVSDKEIKEMEQIFSKTFRNP
jgi:hypothetical protein